MLSTMENKHGTSESTPSICGSGKRKPLQLLTGIFSRKSHRSEGAMPHSPGRESFYISDEAEDELWETLSNGVPEPREALHSPYHARTIDQDMSRLQLSRQDNPFLQVLASRECLNESDDGSEFEEKQLMSKENLSGRSQDPLSLAEVHARLVRSPPPVMWTRSRNSEPSISRLTSQNSSLDVDCVFQFPPSHIPNSRLLSEPSPTHSCRSHASSMPQGHARFLGPFKRGNNTLEILTGKFNLSPQPRRRPESHNKARSYSDFPSS